MIPSYEVGKTRIELAKILTDYLGEYVPPALLETNRSGFKSMSKFLGWECSWFVRIGHKEIMSNLTMEKFVKGVRDGGEIFKIVNGNSVELLIDSAPNTACSRTPTAAKS